MEDPHVDRMTRVRDVVYDVQVIVFRVLIRSFVLAVLERHALASRRLAECLHLDFSRWAFDVIRNSPEMHILRRSTSLTFKSHDVVNGDPFDLGIGHYTYLLRVCSQRQPSWL